MLEFGSTDKVSENLNNNSSHFSHFILPKIEIEKEHGIDKKIVGRERLTSMPMALRLGQTFNLNLQEEPEEVQDAPPSPSFGKTSPKPKLLSDMTAPNTPIGSEATLQSPVKPERANNLTMIVDSFAESSLKLQSKFKKSAKTVPEKHT